MTCESKIILVAMFSSFVGVIGCTEQNAEKSAAAPPVLRAEPSDEPEVLLPSELKRKLKANENAKFRRVGDDIVEAELFQSGIKSIDALEGLPLRFLDLGMTQITDLSPIKGMPLKTLILENTTIDDISAVEGMQLEILQLQNTKVTDLSPIEGMPIRELNLLAVPIDDLRAVSALPLQTLWIPKTGVKDISPLKGKMMASLDIQATQVESLEPLTGMTSLKRLNIAETSITDLTPLTGMQLERITLTPQNIKTGMAILRSMPSLRDIRQSMEAPAQPAAQFWQKYDAGVWTEKVAAEDPEETVSDKADNNEKAAANDAAQEEPKETSDSQKQESDQPKEAANEETWREVFGKQVNKFGSEVCHYR